MSEHKYRLRAHFRATDLAAPVVVTVCSSVAEFHVPAMRLAAKMSICTIKVLKLPKRYCFVQSSPSHCT